MIQPKVDSSMQLRTGLAKSVDKRSEIHMFDHKSDWDKDDSVVGENDGMTNTADVVKVFETAHASN